MNFNKIKTYTISAVFALISLTACKKEYPKLPYTTIERFIVKDASGKELKGQVQHNVIFLSWPSGQALPEFVNPEIVVSERAVVSPVSGEKVALKDGVTYTVTAEDGTKTTYTLKVGNPQPIPYFNIIVDEAYKGQTVVRYGQRLKLSGDFFEALDKTSLYVIKDGKEVKLNINTASFYNIQSDFLNNALEKGIYYVKLVTGSRTVTDKNKTFVVAEPAQTPVFTTASVSAKRGQEFTITGNNLSYMTNIDLQDANFSPVNFVIVAKTANSVTLKVPANASLGDWSGYGVGTYDNPDNYESGAALEVNFSFTVIE